MPWSNPCWRQYLTRLGLPPIWGAICLVVNHPLARSLSGRLRRRWEARRRCTMLRVIFRPTQRHRAPAQGVLTLRALGVLQHLAQRGLANVEIGGALEMFGSDFRFGIHKRAAG